MSVYLEGANWHDRILNHYPPAGDGERYYKIVAPDGSVIAEAAKLELLNTVLPGNEGTPVNAGNMNNILAAMGYAKKNYSADMLAAPYLDSLVGYFPFAGSQLTSAVGDITGENTNCTFVDGPHSGQSMGLKGSGAGSGVTLSTKACPMGARTIRFRIYVTDNTAQTILDETNLSASNYGTCITMDSSRKLRFRVMNGGSAIVDITTNAGVMQNAWADVCFAWDGTTADGRVRVYVNGSPYGKGKASATPSIEQTPTNNTVLLNQAPLASSGGTAAISELEIWEEARYQDAYIMAQQGFSLFDGARVRIKWAWTLDMNTELLLNINEQGFVPVAVGAAAQDTWTDLVYNESLKSFVAPAAAKDILLSTATLPRSENIADMLKSVSDRVDKGILGEFKSACIWGPSNSISSTGFISFSNKVREDIKGVMDTSGRLTIPAALNGHFVLLFLYGGTISVTSKDAGNRAFDFVCFSKNGSTQESELEDVAHAFPTPIGTVNLSGNSYLGRCAWGYQSYQYADYYPLGAYAYNSSTAASDTITRKGMIGVLMRVQTNDFFQLYFYNNSAAGRGSASGIYFGLAVLI